MALRRLKHSLLRLSTEEKAIGLGFLAIVFSSFLPWYSIVFLSDQESRIENGFSGDLGVMGFVIFILSVTGIFYLMGENLRVTMPTFGLNKEKIVLFISSQNAFLALLTIAIYTKRSFEFTNAELRFGLYLAMLGSIVSTLAAFAAQQKTERKEARSFFDHAAEEVEALELPETEIDDETEAESETTNQASDVKTETTEAPLQTSEEKRRIKNQNKKLSAQIDIESYTERYRPPKQPGEEASHRITIEEVEMKHQAEIPVQNGSDDQSDDEKYHENEGLRNNEAETIKSEDEKKAGASSFYED